MKLTASLILIFVIVGTTWSQTQMAYVDYNNVRTLGLIDKKESNNLCYY
jgi:hypothetical protein